MGIGFSIYLFVTAFMGMFFMFMREIYYLNRALDHNKRSNDKLQERLSEELAAVEIEKIFLEDRINQLEEKIIAWRSQTHFMANHQQSDVLQRRLNANFDDDKTRESGSLFKSVPKIGSY